MGGKSTENYMYESKKKKFHELRPPEAGTTGRTKQNEDILEIIT